jgi:hypothetical protein
MWNIILLEQSPDDFRIEEGNYNQYQLRKVPMLLTILRADFKCAYNAVWYI